MEGLGHRLPPEDCVVSWLWAHWGAMTCTLFPLGHPDTPGVGYGDVTDRIPPPPEKLGVGRVYNVPPLSSQVSSGAEFVTAVVPAGCGPYWYHAASHDNAFRIVTQGINPLAGDPDRRRDFGQAFYLNPSIPDAVEWALRE